MKPYNILIISLVLMLGINGLFLAAAGQVPGNKDDEAKVIYWKAKKMIYSKDWRRAAQNFGKIVSHYSESKYIDDSIYWQAYSLNKAAAQLNQTGEALKLREQALEQLVLLLKRYPNSKWVKESKRLTVEIADELVAKGLRQFKKYIEEEAELGEKHDDEDESHKHIRLYALESLLNLEKDKEKAFQRLETIIRTEEDADMRASALFILSQRPEKRLLPLLMEVAQKDKSRKVKEHAIHILGQVNAPESLEMLTKLYNQTGKNDRAIKKIAIYSISTLRSEKAAKELIRIYEKEKDLGLKKSIIFHLGQSKTETARQFIIKILEQRP